MTTSRHQHRLASTVRTACAVLALLSFVACGPTPRSSDSSEQAKVSLLPGAVAIKSEPYRWNTGQVWNYRLLWTNRDRIHASYNRQVGGADNYANAMQTGAAHRLDFGVQVCILEIIHGFKWWATEYRVRVLDGPLDGVEGWVDFDAINAGANPGFQSPGVGCDQL